MTSPTGSAEQYVLYSVYSKGDFSDSQWNILLGMLNDEGYEIVSTASDDYAIHYILKRPVAELKGGQ